MDTITWFHMAQQTREIKYYFHFLIKKKKKKLQKVKH